MQFIKPLPFTEAVQKLGSKSAIGAQLSSNEWAALPVALRERAFFSSTIESVRYLQEMQNSLGDFLTSAKAPVLNEDGSAKLDKSGQPITALKTGSRAKFIEMMRRRAIEHGIGPIDPKDAGTIKDIQSEKRLGLIFDVQIKSAQSYGDRQQGLDPDVLDEFPGQRFIRVKGVQHPRDPHRVFENQVALKTNVNYWLRINQDFGVPWAPWGWGCGHDVEDVDRDTTDALGLTTPGKSVSDAPGLEPFNQNLKASVRNLDSGLLNLLKDFFGAQVAFANGEAQWVQTGELKGK